MPLKLKLAPGERVYISGALLRNNGAACEIEVLNRVPLLRDKDLLVESDARTPCERLYLLIQTLYLDAPEDCRATSIAEELASMITHAAPSTKHFFDQILPLIETREYYRALRITQKLLSYEQNLMSHAK